MIKSSSHLPAPDAAALVHSQQLLRLIQQEITQQNGVISFARFMELALYAPGLGYYSAGAQKFGAAGVASQKAVSVASAENSEELHKAKIGFRYFRPPLHAYVDLDEGQPARVSWKGNTGKVVHASGPWRLSGQWWEEDSWQEDTWEVELSFTGKIPLTGTYCIVFDALQKKWFVRGSYD